MTDFRGRAGEDDGKSFQEAVNFGGGKNRPQLGRLGLVAENSRPSPYSLVRIVLHCIRTDVTPTLDL